jgi:hypothetical protein
MTKHDSIFRRQHICASILGEGLPHVSNILMKKWLLLKKRKRTLWALYSPINRTMNTYPQSVDANSNETR